ncbi:hypothetical protein EBS80_03035 [bacterium]|nr:hypothetical protein [bacterium]
MTTPTPIGNDSLRIVSYCPLCEARFHPMQTRVLSEQGKTRLLHVTCKKCGGATLALLCENETGASTVGLVTDLSPEDVLRFHVARRVSTDDVIDVHKALGEGLSSLLPVPARKRRSRAKAPAKSRRVG